MQVTVEKGQGLLLEDVESSKAVDPSGILHPESGYAIIEKDRDTVPFIVPERVESLAEGRCLDQMLIERVVESGLGSHRDLPLDLADIAEPQLQFVQIAHVPEMGLLSIGQAGPTHR